MSIVDNSFDNWIFIDDGSNNQNSGSRFLLGQIIDPTQKVYLWFGINPSKAMPNVLDPTLQRVVKMSKYNNKSDANWLMANIYPQRSTDPNGMHQKIDVQLHQDNLKVIEDTIKKYQNITVVFAYGNLINIRNYLIGCLDDIKTLIKKYNLSVKVLSITSEGNPHHPLGMSNETTFINYTI